MVESLNAYAAAPPAARDARRKDGVLMTLQVLAEVLKRQKKYAAQLEPLLVAHVFPEFSSPVGFLRARAASMAVAFCDIKFADPNTPAAWLRLMLGALRDPCLPVQVWV